MKMVARFRPVSSGTMRGFSLIELMIAVVLGLVLSAGIVTVYLDGKRNYSYEDEQSRLQENGRYALNLLKTELTLAGFMGGVSNPSEYIDAQAIGGADCAANWALDAKYLVTGTAGDPAAVYGKKVIDHINDFASSLVSTFGDNLAGCITSSEVQSGSDIVVIKRTAGDYTVRNGSFNTGITAAPTDQWYMKYDVDSADMSWVYLASGTLPTADVTAGSGVDYWEYVARAFYIRDFSVNDGDGIPTLCRESLLGDTMRQECLVEGIEDLHIEYGIDLTGDSVPNRFLSDPTAADLFSVVSARIYLLVRSVNTAPGHTDTKTYSLGSKAVAAKNDGFLRKVFSTSVQLRNAVIPSA